VKPPADAERIVSDVAQRVEIDQTRLVQETDERFVPGAYWHDLMEAERIATQVVADAWGDIAADCERALADVHELYRLQAASVLEAEEDLRRRGADSWIAQAVMHQKAFNLAWDVLDKNDLLTELSD
jgi:hypothetical protein